VRGFLLGVEIGIGNFLLRIDLYCLFGTDVLLVVLCGRTLAAEECFFLRDCGGLVCDEVAVGSEAFLLRIDVVYCLFGTAVFKVDVCGGTFAVKACFPFTRDCG